MKVSVLIPAYNAEKYISECIDSICRQTHHDLQIVIIDDGSKDSTLQKIKNLASKDSRIEVYTRENRGVAITRNELINYATGNYSLFVDADDWIEPDMVERLVTMIEKYNAEIAMCSFITEYSNKCSYTRDNEHATLHQWNKTDFLTKFLLHKEITGSLCNKLIQTELYKTTHFTPGIGYGEDAMVMWDILNRSSLMIATQLRLYHYRMNEDSVSHQGFSKSKMSVIPVWEYICSSINNSQQHLSLLSRARYGAEVTLLLLEAAKHHVSGNNSNVKKLRKVLSTLYPFMKRSKTLSKRFIFFAFMAKNYWTITSHLIR